MVAIHLLVAVPVAHHHAIKTQAALEHFRQQVAMAMDLEALPAVKGGHDRERPLLDGGKVPRAMDVTEHLFPVDVVALIDPRGGAPIANEMLGRGHHPSTAHPLRIAQIPLETAHETSRIVLYQRGIFSVALIGSAPEIVPDHRDGGSEIPVDSGGQELPGRGRGDGLQKIPVPRGPKADVMGKERRPKQIVMAMHRIHAPEHGDRRTASPGRQGRLVMRISERQPLRHGSMLVVTREGPATAEDRPQAVFLHLLWGYGADFRLNHLANLFSKGEGRQQRFHLSL